MGKIFSVNQMKPIFKRRSLVSVPLLSPPHKEKHSAGGNSGCNSFGGSYKTDANKISITEIIQTFIACEDERGNVERGFLGVLPKANRFEIKAGKLNLYEGDRLLLTFDAQTKN